MDIFWLLFGSGDYIILELSCVLEGEGQNLDSSAVTNSNNCHVVEINKFCMGKWPANANV